MNFSYPFLGFLLGSYTKWETRVWNEHRLYLLHCLFYNIYSVQGQAISYSNETDDQAQISGIKKSRLSFAVCQRRIPFMQLDRQTKRWINASISPRNKKSRQNDNTFITLKDQWQFILTSVQVKFIQIVCAMPEITWHCWFGGAPLSPSELSRIERKNRKFTHVGNDNGMRNSCVFSSLWLVDLGLFYYSFYSDCVSNVLKWIRRNQFLASGRLRFHVDCPRISLRQCHILNQTETLLYTKYYAELCES